MTTTIPSAPTAAPAVAEGRGRLTVSGGAVERIATRAITEVEGVGGAATRVLGVAVGAEDLDNAAKVAATVTDTTAALDVRLSVAYPASVAATTENARRHLVERVEQYTGLTVARVDITVTALLTHVSPTRRVQ